MHGLHRGDDHHLLVVGGHDHRNPLRQLAGHGQLHRLLVRCHGLRTAALGLEALARTATRGAHASHAPGTGACKNEARTFDFPLRCDALPGKLAPQGLTAWRITTAKGRQELGFQCCDH